MLDLKWVVKNPTSFDRAMEKRGANFQAEKILELDKKYRDRLTKIQDLQHSKNLITQNIGKLRSRGEDSKDLEIKVNELEKEIKILENYCKNNLEYELKKILELVPNIPQETVPTGKDEKDNVTIETWGELTKFDFQPEPHYELGEKLGQMDFKQTGEICGSRYTSLFDDLAKLERAISNFFLDFVGKYGYRETSIPFLVKSEAMFGTGNLPKFAEDSYHTTDNMWLIPTGEVSMTNWVAGRILEEKDLPLRFAAYTPCWRSEAGSTGRDTRGMFRQHQFKKVEIVSLTTPQQSGEELERISHIESELLRSLGLPFRVVLLCSGDMGFSSSKTYDHEIWLPTQNTYREISSCSNCTDFQARRMNARYRSSNRKLNFLHTLNGSALAVGRTLIAIMENYQMKNGDIRIPEVLIPYMPGSSGIIEKSDLFV
ncbi:MAG: serine--tRNA ligase [Rickettsiales bacterium]|jgi:seryl-tRNA synthetase|nr:serine--tRNA ligase [Rickettsiales bacterium]